MPATSSETYSLESGTKKISKVKFDFIYLCPMVNNPIPPSNKDVEEVISPSVMLPSLSDCVPDSVEYNRFIVTGD